MLTDEERRILKRKLENDLCRILASTHAEVDAEYVQMAAEFNRCFLGSANTNVPLRRRGKIVHVHLNVEAGWIILALARLKEGTFGFCKNCGDDIPYSVLLERSTASVCESCQRVTHVVNRN